MAFPSLDHLWILISAGLVFLMQAGFLCLESGMTRSKHAINVALKNLTDFSVSLLLFWGFGFALMFGTSWCGWWGTSGFCVPLDIRHADQAVTFLFQAMFCATASTIVSGAVSGRMRFMAYIVTTVFVSGLIYPLYGHWAWAEHGWLNQLGFVDFAGSTVVHSVGGWAALAAVLVTGNRTGRFEENPAGFVSGSNVPVAMLGVSLLWIGWIGFNGGSTLAFDPRIPGIIGRTFLGGAAGMLTGLAIGALFLGYADVHLAINGSLAGLVAVTAGCHAVTAGQSLLIGSGGAAAMACTHWLLIRLKIDDAIGAIPVHAGAGVWGTVAVALFCEPELLNTGLNRWQQLLVQLAGATSAFLFAFGGGYGLLSATRKLLSLRVSAADEEAGLNVSEHGASTETLDLISEMESQRSSGDFSSHVTVEANSELAPVARQYNRILDNLRNETDRAFALAMEAQARRRQAESAQQELLQKVADLKEFNELAEGRELRMLELKSEVNRLSSRCGDAEPYVVGT